MKLTAPFTSSNAVIRGVTWLVVFLLLTFFWILLLPQIPLDNLFHRFGNIGMTGSQSVLAITLLPSLMLTLLGWIGLRIFNPPAAPATTQANAAPVQTSQVAVISPAKALRIAAWGVVTPLGDAGATIARSQAQDKIFRPDKNIRNTEGHPVHTAAVEEMPLALLNYPDDTRSRAMRISAMLVSVLNTLHNQREELARSGGTPATVYWLVPATMPLDNETRLCFSIAWAHSSWGNIDYSLHLLSDATESAYSVVNNLRELADQSTMPYVLLLAADSLLDPDELVSSLNQGKVFSSKLPDGFIPAEGAAGLILMAPAFAASAHFAGLCTVSPAHREQRTSDRGAKRKVDSSTLTACITGAMTVAGTSADEIGTVIGDTDHRFPRSAEVTQAMEQTLPALDPLSDRINPMVFAGYFGTASDLIHMALAAEAVAATEQAALVVSVASARQTTAMMILPYQS